jgi:hypothetical protein
MILGQKRSQMDSSTQRQTLATKQKQKKQKNLKPKRTTPTQSNADSILSGSVATLDDSRVFRPAAHLAPSDVSFVSADKTKTGFALHKFILRLRSPVFAAILDGLDAPGSSGPGTTLGEPLELKESGADLQLLFQAMYSNDPNSLITVKNVVTLCFLAHKYASTELENACFESLRKLVKKAKLSGTTPTIPELLLLGQNVRNPALLNAVMAKGMVSFCAPPVGAPVPLGAPVGRCSSHPYEPLPCYHGCPVPPPAALLDAHAQALLLKLNPSILVKLIRALVAALGKKKKQPHPLY